MAKDKEKGEGKDTPEVPEIVIVTDDAKNLNAEQGPITDDSDLPAPKVKVKEKPDEKDADEDEPEEEQEDARLGASEDTEAELEAKDKQKSSHKSRRQRQKDAERRLRTERDFLERRNENLEKEVIGLKKRFDESDKSNLDSRIQFTKGQIAKADKIHADAISEHKGDEATEALKIRDNLRDSLRAMEERKLELEKEPEEAAAPIPPAVVENARAWIKRTPWFDPQLRDQDSKIVRALDISVNQDGFTPDTPEYFEELDRRIAEVLPKRAGKKAAKRNADADDEDIDEQDEDQEERPQRRQAKPNGTRKAAGGPRFRTGGGQQLKDNEVYLSPARIAALKEVGAWDDPVLRQKYLKKYQTWDEENTPTR